jgi:hypothetical protein
MANEFKTIKYMPKTTQAKTEYREIDPEDMAWLQTELIRWLAHGSEIQQRRDEDAEYFVKHWWTKRTQTLPRGQHGPNSPQSFVGGTVNNLVFGSQRDLSNKQMDSIQNISNVMGQAFEGCHQIRFQIGF